MKIQKHHHDFLVFADFSKEGKNTIPTEDLAVRRISLSLPKNELK